MTQPDESLDDPFIRASSNLSTFASIVKRYEDMPDIKGALTQSATHIRRGRTLTQIAMDNCMENFVLVAKSVIDNNSKTDDEAIPLEIYRQMMSLRDGEDVPLQAAQTHLHEALQKAKASGVLIHPVPEFLTIIKDSAPADVTQTLLGQWDSTLADMGQIFTAADKAGVSVKITQRLRKFLSAAMPGAKTPAAANDAEMLAGGGKKPGDGGSAKPAAIEYVLALTNSIDVTEKVKNKQTSPVFGMDETVNGLVQALIQKKNPRVMLHGPDGSGKTAAIHALAEKILSGNVPEKLKDAKIFRLSLASLLLESKGGEDGPSPTTALSHLLEQIVSHNRKGDKKIILHIDDIGADASHSSQGLKQAASLMRSMIAHKLKDKSDGMTLILEANDQHLAVLEKSDPLLLQNITKIGVKPISREHIMEYLRQEAVGVTQHHSIEVPSDDINEYIIDKSDLYVMEHQPRKSGRVLEGAAALAEASREPQITEDHVEAIISQITGLPKELIGKGISERIKSLDTELPKMVRGQPEIQKIIDHLGIANAGIKDDPNKPLGSFLLLGPTGVGKTETARALSEHLGIPLVSIHMENFMDQHAKSKLVGAPPGYIGYDDPAEMEKVRGKPYCVLLLDEIEKAHKDVFNQFLHALDEGEMQLLNTGEPVNMRNVILIMTSNLGTKEAHEARSKGKLGFESDDEEENQDKRAEVAFREAVKDRMPPEFINRIDSILVYGNLDDKEVVRKIAISKIEKVSKSLRHVNKNITLKISDEALAKLTDMGYSTEYNARYMKRTVDTYVKTPFAKWLTEHARSVMQPTTFLVKDIGEKFDFELVPGKPPEPRPAP